MKSFGLKEVLVLQILDKHRLKDVTKPVIYTLVLKHFIIVDECGLYNRDGGAEVTWNIFLFNVVLKKVRFS